MQRSFVDEKHQPEVNPITDGGVFNTPPTKNQL